MAEYVADVDSELDALRADNERLHREIKRLRAVLEGSEDCQQHEHFSGGCPCNCHDVAVSQAKRP